MFNYLAQLDARVFTAVNSFENSALTFLGNTAATEIGLFVIIALLALVFYWKNKKELLRFFVSFVAAAAAITAVKFLFGRARPIETLHIISKLDAYPFSPSFPSFTAGQFGVLAYLLAVRFPRYRVPIFILGFFAGFIRVYMGAHYPSDVVAGYLLGFFLPLFLHKFLRAYC